MEVEANGLDEGWMWKDGECRGMGVGAEGMEEGRSRTEGSGRWNWMDEAEEQMKGCGEGTSEGMW